MKIKIVTEKVTKHISETSISDRELQLIAWALDKARGMTVMTGRERKELEALEYKIRSL